MYIDKGKLGYIYRVLLYLFGGLLFFYNLIYSEVDSLSLNSKGEYNLPLLDTIENFYDSIYTIQAKITIHSSLMKENDFIEGFIYYCKNKGFVYNIYTPSRLVMGNINDTIFLMGEDSILYLNTEINSKFYKNFSKIYNIRNYNFYKVLKNIYKCKITHVFSDEVIIKCFVDNPKYIKAVYLKIDPIYKVYKSIEIYSLDGYIINAVYMENPIKRGKFSISTEIVNTRVISKGYEVSDTLKLRRVIFNKNTIYNKCIIPQAKEIKLLTKKMVEKQLKRKLK